MSDPLKYFRIEARELAEQLQAGLLELERTGPQEAAVSRLLRQAHTLKGAARVVKQLQIANLAHRLEDALVALRSLAPASSAEVQPLLELVDRIAGEVRQLASPSDSQAPAAPATTAGAEAEAVAPVGLPAPVALQDIDGLMDGVSELGFQLARARRALPALARSRAVAERLTQRLEAGRSAGSGPAALASLRDSTRDLLAELSKAEREVSASLEQATREMAQIRDRADQMRLVAAGGMFGSLERAARDACISLGRSATFEASGGDVRVEAEVLGAVQRALLQAVRNAIAHGIEPSAERGKSGKPVRGLVRLEVFRRRDRICFVCSDDGRGIDLDAVRRQAEQHGRLASADSASEAELLSLLLGGGISTSASVSEVAGRGVGLDLIREALGAVGGAVELRSRTGRGTTLELSVPATLQAVEALLVEAGGQVWALPLNRVLEARRIDAASIRRDAQAASIQFYDQSLRLVALDALFQAALANARPRDHWSVLIVRGESGLLALGVDKLLGSESVLARSLPESVLAAPAVTGVALDSDGNPRLLLDPEALVRAAAEVVSRPTPEAPARRSILVVDDSLTTRMLEQSILESAGYEVALATSGEEGLKLARQRPYQLLLVDVEMPGMDGFSFIRQVRADPALAGTPALLVTSRASAEDLALGRAAGADGHIDKSDFNQLAFLECIERLLA